MKKKELAIVFGITKNLDFALATVLIGIKKHFSISNYDIIVYHDGISDNVKNNLNSILPCQFILYKGKVDSTLLDQEYLKIYSNMCLARFECFDLLHKYKKIIWHDVDILIQRDFKDLTKYGDKSGLAMTYSDINFLTEANFNEPIPEYNMFLPLLNSGIIVFSDKLKNYDIMTSWCYNMLKKLDKKLRYLDQGVLNLLVQEFKINVEAINIDNYCCHPLRKNYRNATIIHAYGYDKFWNAYYLLKKFPEWEENLNSWGEIIREEYSQKEIKIPKISVVMSVFKRITYLDEAIKSILNQTFGNFELIIVIEYSEEQENINKFLKKIKDKRIRIINNKEKLGFAESLNVGIKASKGEFIARMDDDDISLPIRFQLQLGYFEKNQDISILGTAIYSFMNDNREVYPLTDSEKIKTYTLINNQIYHPTVMMRKKDLLKYNLLYDSNYKTEDAELWSRAIKYVKLSNTKEILLKYRVSNENETLIAKNDVLNSDIRITQKQLQENLKLNLEFNKAIYISGRVSKHTYIYNNKNILSEKRRIAKMVYRRNKKIKFYKKEYLAEALELDRTNLIKKMLKRIMRPLYNRLIYRISLLIDNKIWNFYESQDD